MLEGSVELVIMMTLDHHGPYRELQANLGYTAIPFLSEQTNTSVCLWVCEFESMEDQRVFTFVVEDGMD